MLLRVNCLWKVNRFPLIFVILAYLLRTKMKLDMNGPVKEIVEISQVKGLFESPRDKLIGSVKDFPPQLKSFLVALVLDNLADNSFTLQDALRAYNTYAVQKALSTEAPSTISSHIQTLSCYGAISIVGGKHRVSSPSKVKYSHFFEIVFSYA